MGDGSNPQLTTATRRRYGDPERGGGAGRWPLFAAARGIGRRRLADTRTGGWLAWSAQVADQVGESPAAHAVEHGTVVGRREIRHGQLASASTSVSRRLTGRLLLVPPGRSRVAGADARRRLTDRPWPDRTGNVPLMADGESPARSQQPRARRAGAIAGPVAVRIVPKRALPRAPRLGVGPGACRSLESPRHERGMCPSRRPGGGLSNSHAPGR